MTRTGDGAQVDRRLAASIRGDPAQLYAAARHLIVNGGKRLRPFMVFKSCQLLGGKRRDAMAAAAAVEMIHNFTLVHDDIMDNDEVRHGVPTVHRKFGMPVAILAGDVLFSKAYQIISGPRLSPEISIELVRRLAAACVSVCEGQIYDIAMAQDKKTPTPAQYIRMIRKKTAALFDVSCAMGALCSCAKKGDVKNLSSFGDNLGVAFQITDDLIGVMGDPAVTKKPVGNDLREGKKSLPILLAIKKAGGADRRAIMKQFGNPRATKGDLREAVGIIAGLGIEEAIRGRAMRYADAARASLDGYSGVAKGELVELLDFVVNRRL